jgi:hypoxanthine phosphoribosyltransferase
MLKTNSRQKLTVLLNKEEIQEVVSRLADEIARDYEGRHPLLIGVLKGSFIFMSDLARRLDFPLEIEFVRLSSYGSGTESSGKIKLAHTLKTPIKGRDVLIVEDIVDTGQSLNFLMNYLQKKKPLSLKLCCLLDKPSRRNVPVPVHYRGFTIPDKFLVGYGLDYAEQYRNLPDICCLEYCKE